MPKKKTKIRFDMDELSDITDDLIEINNNFYIQSIHQTRGSLRFSVPAQIKADLDLQPGDDCFFCQYSEGFYLSFNHKPVAATKNQIRLRKLTAAGKYKTLYLCIPPFIRNLYQEDMTAIQLIQTKGFQPYEWQIKFLFTEFT